jgi:hypothetical protein
MKETIIKSKTIWVVEFLFILSRESDANNLLDTLYNRFRAGTVVLIEPNERHLLLFRHYIMIDIRYPVNSEMSNYTDASHHAGVMIWRMSKDSDSRIEVC